MNDEQEIRNLVHTWMEATKAGDSATVLGLMMDDVMFLVPGQEPFGKSAFAQASAAQDQASLKFDGKGEVLEVTVLGDWAYIVTKLKVIATQPGNSPPTVLSGHTLSILRKDKGKWKIARDANLLAPSHDHGGSI